MADKISTIQILMQIRNARSRGPTSSESYNDTITEIAHDLAEFNTQWNNRLVPLTNTLPDGSLDTNIDAFTNGLDGNTIFTRSDASSTTYLSYYNTVKSRPYTIYEQFSNVYSAINQVNEDLQSNIDNLVNTATLISIVDSNSLYDASNVEDALTEVMQKINLVTGGGIDLSAVDQNYLPALDNTYDIGSSALRIKDIYLGPTSLNIVSKASDGGGYSSKTFTLGISTGNKLQIKDDSTVIAEFDSTAGATFPAGTTINTLSGDLGWSSKTFLNGSTVDGNLLLKDSNGNDFGLLQLGGLTSSYPAIKRSSATLQIRLGDDSNYANLSAGDIISETGKVSASTYFELLNSSRIYAPTDKNIELTDSNGNDFNLLQLGGISSDYPALKRETTNLRARLADNSADTNFYCSSLTTTVNGIYIPSSTILQWGSLSYIWCNTDGNIMIAQNGGDGFGLLQFGGTTSGYPAWKRSGTILEARLADDSANTAIRVGRSNDETEGNIHYDGSNFQGYTSSGWINLDLAPNGSNGEIQYKNGSALGSTSNLYWDGENGRLGIGTNTPSTHLEVLGSDIPADFERNGISSTTAISATAKFRTTCSNSMAEGFGGSLVFDIEDNAGVENTIAHIRWRRETTDSSGRLEFRTATSGSITTRMVLPSTGEVMLSEIASGSTPDANFGAIYVKTDDNLYFKDDGGNEYQLSLDNNDTLTLSGLNSISIDTTGNIAADGGQIGSDIQDELTPAGTTQTIDWDDGNFAHIDLGDATGDVTISFTNSQPGFAYAIKVQQDAATPRDIIWPASVLWPDGVAPTISVGAEAIDIVTLIFDGTYHHATIAQNMS